MKPASFEFFAPSTVAEAISLLETHGFDAKLLAGGQSLIPTMNFRLAQPGVIIDLNRVEGLSYIREEKDTVVIGAMTRQYELEKSKLIKKKLPLLHETMPNIAHPQIRNRGTLGGSLVHADPAAELPSVMCALDAVFHLTGPEGEREVPANDFYMGMFAVDLEAEEILTAVSIPVMNPQSGSAFLEIARRHGDYALAGVAVIVDQDKKGVCTNVRIVYLSVGDAPVTAENAADVLQGKKVEPALIAAAAKTAAAEDVEPEGDIHASAEYRRHLTEVLTRRALETAFARVR